MDPLMALIFWAVTNVACGQSSADGQTTTLTSWKEPSILDVINSSSTITNVVTTFTDQDNVANSSEFVTNIKSDVATSIRVNVTEDVEANSSSELLTIATTTTTSEETTAESSSHLPLVITDFNASTSSAGAEPIGDRSTISDAVLTTINPEASHVNETFSSVELVTEVLVDSITTPVSTESVSFDDNATSYRGSFATETTEMITTEVTEVESVELNATVAEVANNTTEIRTIVKNTTEEGEIVRNVTEAGTIVRNATEDGVLVQNVTERATLSPNAIENATLLQNATEVEVSVKNATEIIGNLDNVTGMQMTTEENVTIRHVSSPKDVNGTEKYSGELDWPTSIYITELTSSMPDEETTEATEEMKTEEEGAMLKNDTTVTLLKTNFNVTSSSKLDFETETTTATIESDVNDVDNGSVVVESETPSSQETDSNSSVAIVTGFALKTEIPIVAIVTGSALKTESPTVAMDTKSTLGVDDEESTGSSVVDLTSAETGTSHDAVMDVETTPSSVHSETIVRGTDSVEESSPSSSDDKTTEVLSGSEERNETEFAILEKSTPNFTSPSGVPSSHLISSNQSQTDDVVNLIFSTNILRDIFTTPESFTDGDDTTSMQTQTREGKKFPFDDETEFTSTVTTSTTTVTPSKSVTTTAGDVVLSFSIPPTNESTETEVKFHPETSSQSVNEHSPIKFHPESSTVPAPVSDSGNELSKHHEELNNLESANAVTVVFTVPQPIQMNVYWFEKRNQKFREFVITSVNNQEKKGWPNFPFKDADDFLNEQYSIEWVTRKKRDLKFPALLKMDDLVYIAPSPMAEDRNIYVAFFIRNSTSSESSDIVSGAKIFHALNLSLPEFEQEIGLNISRITPGIILVRHLESFFIRHAIMFTALLAVAVFCICVIIFGLIYIRCKNISGKWKRNEFGDKNKLDVNLRSSRDLGNLNTDPDLQNDETPLDKNGQPCVNGNNMHVIQLGDEECWVMPYDEANTPKAKQQKQQQQDTKL